MDPQIPGALASAESAPRLSLAGCLLDVPVVSGRRGQPGSTNASAYTPYNNKWTRDISIATQPRRRAGRRRESVGPLILVLVL